MDIKDERLTEWVDENGIVHYINMQNGSGFVRAIAEYWRNRRMK